MKAKFEISEAGFDKFINALETKEAVLKINDRRKTGDVTRISEETGYSVSHVSNVLNLRRSNKTITQVAKNITRRRIPSYKYSIEA